MNPSVILANLYLRHFSELRAFLFRHTGCREIAAELTQETFIRIMGYQTDTSIQNARALLYRIAGNLAIDHHRTCVKFPESVSIDDLPQHELPATELTDPARLVAARQLLENCVSRLMHYRHNVIVLSYCINLTVTHMRKSPKNWESPAMPSKNC